MAPKAPKRGTDALAADNAKQQSKMEKRKKSKKSDKSNAQAVDSAANGQANNGTSNTSSKKSKSSKRTALIGRPPQLDPLLLARGMSSRYLSSKISHQITTLAKDDIEKDLRHMEAYRNACNGYNQQLFVYKNQELVRSGYFGTFAPFPGADGDVIHPSAAHVSSSFAHGSKFSMPIRIDPEEEKRLSLLRKKIHQSEFEREKLETEYLSLRAHYIHEIQLVRKTQLYEMGRWKLLKDLMERRGKVLGLMRVKVAMGRDIESLLKYRGELAEKVKNGDIKTGGEATAEVTNGSASAMNMNGAAPNASSGNDEKKKAEEKKVDLLEIWNDINAQLKEAEMACIELETPYDLTTMISTSDKAGSNNSSGRSKSPTRDSEKGAKTRKRSSSITSADESTNDSGNAKKSKSPIPPGLEPHVIPWDCMVEPQTPYDVPLLLSCLSSATDRAVGFGKLWYGYKYFYAILLTLFHSQHLLLT